MSGDASSMDAESRSQPVQAVRSWPTARLAVWDTVLGVILSSATVTLSALSVISVQQSIAMALAATLTTLGGLIAWTVPDAWVAWRRFLQRRSRPIPVWQLRKFWPT